MKCTDCEGYYLGCDTEVFNYGYEQDKAEECILFTKLEIIKFENNLKTLARKEL